MLSWTIWPNHFTHFEALPGLWTTNIPECSSLPKKSCLPASYLPLPLPPTRWRNTSSASGQGSSIAGRKFAHTRSSPGCDMCLLNIQWWVRRTRQGFASLCQNAQPSTWWNTEWGFTGCTPSFYWLKSSAPWLVCTVPPFHTCQSHIN